MTLKHLAVPVTTLLAAATLSMPGCIIVVDKDHDDDHYIADYKSGRRQIGVTLDRVGDATASHLHLDPDRVCMIEHVYDGTPAERAGLCTHDIVTHIDGHEGASVDQLRAAIRATDPGDEIRLTVLRAGEPREVTVEVERRQ